MIAEVLEAALRSGELSVARGPELLPILREAGVVDAGGYGLTVMFAGVIAALRGTEAPKLAHHTPARITHPQHESTTYRYCTNFAVTGEDLDPAAWNDQLERLGDSVLVVGDSHTLKVHLHTDEPERATALFEEIGDVSHLDVADMTEQVQRAQRAPRRGDRRRGACSRVVAGAGMRELFEGLGAVRARRRQHAQPLDLRAAGRHPRRPRRGGRRAAELAERDHGRRARRRAGGEDRPRRPVALDAGRPRRRRRARPDARRRRERRRRCAPRSRHVRTGAVTEAARDDAEGRFRRGEAVGFVDEQLVAWGEPGETLEAVLGELGREAELLTLIEGDGAPLDSGGVAALVPGGVDVEFSRGDQPAYWWLIAAE